MNGTQIHLGVICFLLKLCHKAPNLYNKMQVIFYYNFTYNYFFCCILINNLSAVPGYGMARFLFCKFFLAPNKSRGREKTMKVLILPQPWASLLCSGLIDVFDIGVDLRTNRCPVLVYAAPWRKYSNPNDAPLEWQLVLSAAQLMGMTPLFKDLPYDCYIGSAEASKMPYDRSSFWLFYAKPETTYVFHNAKVFDEPIHHRIVDESQIPAGQKVLIAQPARVDDSFVLPVNNLLFSQAREGFSFEIPLTEGFHKMFYGDGKPFATIVLVNGCFMKKFVFERDNDFVISMDEKGKPKHFFSVKSWKPEVRASFKINLRTQL